ncbi:MAG: hypothetical protein ABI251_00145, partial [Mycobacteriaceae bacterium]
MTDEQPPQQPPQPPPYNPYQQRPPQQYPVYPPGYPYAGQPHPSQQPHTDTMVAPPQRRRSRGGPLFAGAV